MPEEDVTVFSSMGATINIGNFQSQKIDVGIAGVPINCTPEHLAELLQGGKVTITTVIEMLALELSEKVEELGGFRS